jgi:gliding motility-associated-like protein
MIQYSIVTFLFSIIVFSGLNAQCSYTKQIVKIDERCGNDGQITAEIVPSGVTQFTLKSGLNTLVNFTGSKLNVTGLSPGIYDMYFRDNATSCLDSVKGIQIIANPNKFSMTQIIDTPSCATSNNGRISNRLNNAAYPVTFQWSHNASLNDSIAINLPPNTYNLKATDANGCIVNQSVILPSLRLRLRYDSFKMDKAECNQDVGSLEVFVSSGYPPYNYLWSDNGSTVNPRIGLSEGVYEVKVSDFYGCDTLTLSGLQVIKTNGPKGVIEGTDSICPLEGFGKIYVKVTEGDFRYMTYLWLDNGSLDSFRNGITAGRYRCVLRDRVGCTDTLEKEVFERANISVELKGKTEIVQGESVEIRIVDTSNLSNLTWSSTFDLVTFPNNVGIISKPEFNTRYTLEGLYKKECRFITNFDVTIIEAIDNLVYPEAFSPNGDNINDEYFLLGRSNLIKSFEFLVYNRWGDLVYTANSPDFKWSGQDIQGNSLESGIYTFIAKYFKINSGNTRIHHSGTILIVK